MQDSYGERKGASTVGVWAVPPGWLLGDWSNLPIKALSTKWWGCLNPRNVSVGTNGLPEIWATIATRKQRGIAPWTSALSDEETGSVWLSAFTVGHSMAVSMLSAAVPSTSERDITTESLRLERLIRSSSPTINSCLWPLQTVSLNVTSTFFLKPSRNSYSTWVAPEQPVPTPHQTYITDETYFIHLMNEKEWYGAAGLNHDYPAHVSSYQVNPNKSKKKKPLDFEIPASVLWLALLDGVRLA